MAKNNSLKAFSKAQDLKVCKVCQLPKKLRQEIHHRAHRITFATVVDWLETLGYKVTIPQLINHSRGAHAETRRG